MSKEWDARDVNMVDDDVVIDVVERGEDGTQNEFDIPSDASEISDIVLVACSNGATAGKGGVLYRLSGGLVDGEEILPAHGSGASIATGNERLVEAHQLSFPEGEGIRVKPGGKITVKAEMVGEDTGEVAGAIGLAFRVPGGG